MKYFMTLIIGVLLFSCTELTATRLPSKPVGSSFKLTGMGWQSGSIMLLAVELKQHGENTAVCGAWALSNDAKDAEVRLADEVLANGEIIVGDDVVVDTAGFFAAARYQGRKLPSGTANCIESTTPWKPAYATARPKFNLSKRRFTLVD